MRHSLELLVVRLGLWYPLVHLDGPREVLKWLLSGCPSPPPRLVKLWLVRSYCERFRLGTFIETGTHLGLTAEWMARTGRKVISIELSGELYQRAKQRLRRYSNISLLHGDSSQLLPSLLTSLSEPACFWLDAHFSGGETARGTLETPILHELKAVLGHSIRGHVILVDDARFFTGENDWPLLEDVLAMVRQTGWYQAEVSTDIIRIIPRPGW